MNRYLSGPHRKPGRVTTLVGHRVRVLWWHDFIGGIGVVALALTVIVLTLAIR